jgi:feruloyl-CoA synthase
MSATTKRQVRSVNVAPLRAIFDRRENGVTLVRSPEPLGPYPVRVTDRLELWAERTPRRIFLAQRAAAGGWQQITYAETLERVQRIAGGLLRSGLSPSKPLMILSGNSIEHALLALAAMHVGIPYAPIAPAYSLAVKEFTTLNQVRQNLTPGMVFVDDGTLFAPALKQVVREEIAIVHLRSEAPGSRSLSLAELENEPPSETVEETHARVGADSIAKILYTSGSTGLSKGVITSHRMLCSNQQMLVQMMPCLCENPPVVCDWLPWNHTFGGSHNFGIVLYNGGTLYIDGGKPTAELFDETVRNLREIAPTAYFNVPKGYEMLLGFLRQDPKLRSTFFTRLSLLFFAGAGLSQHVWDEFQNIAFDYCGEEILVVTGLGATETAPFAISTGAEGSASGRIGLPVPGVELKLVPSGERTEARLRGPSITPGFWRRPDLDGSAFDEEKFYCMGDAVKFVDPQDPLKGLLFDGRLNEDFKLSSGTWVRVGSLRMRLLAHFGNLLQDVVLAGPDRDYLGALFFPSLDACRKLCEKLPERAEPAIVLAEPEVRGAFERLLNHYDRAYSSNSTRIERAILVDAPLSLETQEITDKGSINYRTVLKNRAALVEDLYWEPAPIGVLVAERLPPRAPHEMRP